MKLFRPLHTASRVWRACLALLAMTAVMLAASVNRARAESYDIIPSLTVKEEYSDNIYFSSWVKKGAFITTLSPRVELVKRDMRTDARLQVGIDGIFYAGLRNSETAMNQRYSGRLSRSLTEKLTLSVSGEYLVINQPDETTDLYGSVINALRSNRQNYSAGIGYSFTEKNRVDLSYQFLREDYPGSTASNNRVHGAGLTYEHDLAGLLPSAIGRVNLGFSRFDFPRARTDSWSATVGIGWALSEIWQLSFDAGGRYTVSDIEWTTSSAGVPYTAHEANSGFGWVARASLSVNGETQNGSLNFSRDVGASSSRNSTSENTTVDLAYHRYLTSKLLARVTGGYQNSSTSGGGFTSTRVDEDYLRFTAGFRYEFTKNMSLDATYAYKKAIYRQNDRSADRNSIAISFTIRHPLLDRW